LAALVAARAATAAVLAALAATGVAASPGCDDDGSVLPGPGDAGSGPDGGGFGGAGGNAFTIVVLPDTQYYASSYPEIFEAQTTWIVANKAALDIAFVLHEGDIVDAGGVALEWERASRSLHRLDGVVPYFITPGNHDYANARRETPINDYFPVSGFAAWPWFKGTAEPDRIENNYGIVSTTAGFSFLVFAIEFGPRDQILEWVDRVLTENADLPAIIVTHAYLYNDGTRYDHVARPDQLWSPYHYTLEGLPGGVNDGEEMWQAVVSRHDNVRFVFSGHALPPDGSTSVDTAVRLTSTRESGSQCHQVLANYQLCSAPPCAPVMGGGGYLRILRYDPDARRMSVRTYSPHLKNYKTDPANQFELEDM
jgi:hypothetical protein